MISIQPEVGIEAHRTLYRINHRGMRTPRRTVDDEWVELLVGVEMRRSTRWTVTLWQRLFAKEAQAALLSSLLWGEMRVDMACLGKFASFTDFFVSAASSPSRQKSFFGFYLVYCRFEFLRKYMRINTYGVNLSDPLKFVTADELGGGEIPHGRHRTLARDIKNKIPFGSL